MKVAIIGAGRQGGRRAKAAKEYGDKITLVVDTNLELAAALAKEYSGAKSVDWKSAVKDKDVDSVVICTPNDTHAAIAIEALKNGKNVFCEKPVARNPEEARQILDAAKQSRAVLKCGFTLRAHPAIAKAKKHVENGGVGKLLFMRCNYGITGRSGYEKDWRMNTSISGGGQLMDQGQHILDLFRWFGGDIKEVTGYADSLYWGASAEDNAFALLRSQSGHICMMHTSWTEWKNLFSFEVFGDEGYVKVEGLGGSYGTERLILGKKDLDKPFVQEVEEFKGADISWHVEWEEFATAVKEGQQSSNGAYDGWAAVKLAFAIYESSKSGKCVKLDW